MALSRRAVIGSCVMLAGAGQGVLWPRKALAMPVVAIPQRPMRLSRRLERSLSGAETLTVTRNWLVDFRVEGDAIAINGLQTDVQIEAPESLASLAAIEQSRSTEDMWPIVLSSNGMIVAAGPETSEAALASAFSEAEKILAERSAPVSEQDAHRQFMRQLELARTSLMDRLPDDLFYPAERPMRVIRPIAMADGQPGEFEVTYDATATPEKGWLLQAERRIITRFGQAQQYASELWELSEI